MTPHPANPSTRESFTSFVGLDRIVYRSILFILLLTGITTAQAELYQTISVNVMAPDVFRLARKQYPFSEMTAIVAGEIRGTSRVQVKLFLPLGIKKEIIEDIKDRCRKAGASSFFIVYKS